MKRLFLALLLSPIFSFAQVGIGTTAPNATLDIRSSNQATPIAEDGILIPKIDDFPTPTTPGAAQTGMLVYVTGAGAPAKGFYYWDNSIPAWVPITSIERIDDLIDGKSDVDGTEDGSSIFLGINSGENDDSANRQNVGIGFQTMQTNVTGISNASLGYRALRVNTGDRNTAIGHTALAANSSGNNNTALGGQALSSNTTGNSNIAVGAFSLANNVTGRNNVASGNQSLRSNVFGENNAAYGDYSGRVLDFNNSTDVDNDQNVYIGGSAGNSDRNAARNVYIGFNAGAGDYNIATGTGTLEDKSRNIFIGYEAGYNEVNSDRLYIENSNAGQNGALIYGRFDTDLLRINGTLQIGNPVASNGYAFPTTDGTANQVLVTDGAGAVTWQNNTVAPFGIARATLSADQDLNTNNWTQIAFDGTDFDLNTDFDTANNEFDVPADGIYRITAMYTSTASVNNTNTFGIRIRAGGAIVQEVFYKHMNENSLVVRQLSTLVELSSGDTIEVEARSNVASVITIDSSSNLTSFSVERVR